jgi:hypothetical protein
MFISFTAMSPASSTVPGTPKCLFKKESNVKMEAKVGNQIS